MKLSRREVFVGSQGSSILHSSIKPRYAKLHANDICIVTDRMLRMLQKIKCSLPKLSLSRNKIKDAAYKYK